MTYKHQTLPCMNITSNLPVSLTKYQYVPSEKVNTKTNVYAHIVIFLSFQKLAWIPICRILNHIKHQLCTST